VAIFDRAIVRLLPAVPRPVVQKLSERYIAGPELKDAREAVRRINTEGRLATIDVLGEEITRDDEARAIAGAYRDVFETIGREGLDSNVSIKLTGLGLELELDLCREIVEAIVVDAAARGNFVRIDMEDSRYVDATLRVYRRLREAGLDNVGTVLQSYLYRSEDDLRALLPLGPNLRLVKGAYLEPPEVAYPQKRDVDAAYASLLETSLGGEGFTAVATHDEALIEHAISFAREHGIPNERFQFQMLYGVRPRLQLDLVRRGFDVLVATPYGPQWYRYLMRRLAERPANLFFLLRNLVRG